MECCTMQMFICFLKKNSACKWLKLDSSKILQEKIGEPSDTWSWLVVLGRCGSNFIRDSPTVWPLCAFFFILLQFYVPFYVKKKKIDNFMCLLEFECAKRLKAHSRAIPVLWLHFSKSYYELITWALPVKFFFHECHWTPFMISQHWIR